MVTKIKNLLSAGVNLVYKTLVPKNKKVFVVLILFAVLSSMLVGFAVRAGFGEDVINTMSTWLGKMMAFIFYYIAQGLAIILKLIFTLVIWTSTYDNLVGSEVVTKGWVIIRDLCNMGLVLVLLLYAFATILRLENRWFEGNALVKILIVAVAVNFSRLFCGLIVDIAQVFMMTFVNGYAATAGANFINGIGLTSYLTISNDAQAQSLEWFEVVLTILIAIVYLGASIIVLLLIAFQLLGRIVMIWILTILSPVAFLQFIGFKKVSKYTQQWWNEFGNWVLMGPLLAFFLWLSLLMMQNTDEYIMAGTAGEQAQALKAENANNPTTTKNGLEDLDKLAPMAISLAMLYGAFKISRDLGGKMGSFLANQAKSVGQTVTGYRTARWAGRKTQAWGTQKVKNVGTSVKSGLAKASAKVGESKVGRVATGTAAAVGGLMASPVRTVRGAVAGASDAVRRSREAGGGVFQRGVDSEGNVRQGMLAAAVGGAGVAVAGSVKSRYKVGSSRSGKRSKSIASRAAKERIKLAEENFKYLEESGDDQSMDALRATANDVGAGKYDRAAALKILAKKDKLESSDQEMVSQVLGSMKDEPGAHSEIADAMGDKFAHMKYDLSGEKGRTNFEKDLKRGKVKFGDLSSSVLNDEKAVNIARRTLGARRFSEEMEKMVKTQPGAKADVSASLISQKKAVEKDRAAGVEGVRPDDSQHILKTQALVSKNIAGTYKDVPETDLQGHIEELVRSHGERLDDMNFSDLEKAAADTSTPEGKKAEIILDTITRNVSDGQLREMSKKGSGNTVKLVVQKRADQYNRLKGKNDAESQRKIKVIIKQARKMAANPEFSGATFDPMRQIAMGDLPDKIKDLQTKLYGRTLKANEKIDMMNHSTGLVGERNTRSGSDAEKYSKEVDRLMKELRDLEKDKKKYE